MILVIDSSDMKKVTVSLKKDGEVIQSLSEENKYGSQLLLPLIEKLVKKNAAKLGTKTSKNPDVSIPIHTRSDHSIWEQINGIEVETGPGSFTGLRVGVSVANALGFALRIPVNGKKIETELVY